MIAQRYSIPCTSRRTLGLFLALRDRDLCEILKAACLELFARAVVDDDMEVHTNCLSRLAVAVVAAANVYDVVVVTVFLRCELVAAEQLDEGVERRHASLGDSEQILPQIVEVWGYNSRVHRLSAAAAVAARAVAELAPSAAALVYLYGLHMSACVVLLELLVSCRFNCGRMMICC